MMSRSNWLILALAALAAVIGGYAQHRLGRPQAADPVLIGKHLNALRLPDLEGRPHQLNEYRGRRVLVNFWASWCGPCLDELPALARMQAKFGERGPIIVGIAMDEPDRVRAFLAVHPVNFPILLGQFTAPSTSRLAGDIDEVLPYSVLIDADGHVIDTHAGALSESMLTQWLTAQRMPPRHGD